MKKITVLLLMAALCVTINTKVVAQETKNQFVKWETVPKVDDVKVSWFKNAVQGKSIPGAKVRSGAAAAYKTVWGEALYNKVVSAEESRFKLYKSKGGEINWAISADGTPVESGVLGEDVWVVTLDGQEIAKWGTNGCFNALSFRADVADGDDPDNKKPGSKTAASNGGMSMTNGSNSITFTGNTGGPSATDALFLYKLGAGDRQGAMDHDAITFMAISNNAVSNAKSFGSNCNSCGSTGTTSGTASIMYAAPSSTGFIAQPSGGNMNMYAANNSGTLNVNETIKYKRDFVDYAGAFRNIAGGARDIKEMIWGSDVNVNLNNRLSYNPGTVGYYSNANPTVGFQGDSRLGQTYTAQQVNTSNGNGGYSNTQIF